ncbi:MAG: sugar ABC transporter substrate-binding protein [Clostridiaceae bacterium]|nr:sugar ABC transporter substrate-binding protein [Clostridiaceae bacterium]
MKKKILMRILVVVLIISIPLGLLACGKTDKSDSETATKDAKEDVEKETVDEEKKDEKTEEDEDIVIGFSNLTLKNEFMVALQDGIEDKCKELDVKLIAVNPELDAETQIQQIESFISQEVDAIIIDPVDSNASAPAVEKAKDAGIPIVCVNSITDAEPDAFVGSNDEEAAEIAINYLAERLDEKGNIFMIHGNPGQSAEVKRSDGAYKTLENYPNMELKAEDYSEQWSREDAMKLTENWLQAFGDDVDGIFSHNDDMAMGSLLALENAGVKEKVVLIGVDANPEALQAVKDGRLDATVFQDAYGQGQGSVEVAVKLVKGEVVEEQGFIPFQLVTIENVEDYIK